MVSAETRGVGCICVFRTPVASPIVFIYRGHAFERTAGASCWRSCTKTGMAAKVDSDDWYDAITGRDASDETRLWVECRGRSG